MSRDLARALELVRVGAISERASCLSKVSYPTLNDARHGAKHIAAKTGREIFTYFCQFCSHWHCTKAKHSDGADYRSNRVVVGKELRRSAT